MKFNSLIPELSVTDINKTKDFYINILGFKLEYERKEDKFAFLSLEGNQLMFEEINDNWNTGALEYPFGRGINFEMTVSDVDKLYEKVLDSNIKIFIPISESHYKSGDLVAIQKEFLIQDPDGYLLRFTN